jgi:hypothetical protein
MENEEITSNEVRNYNINRPWLSMDTWQLEYIRTPAEQDCFVLCPRQFAGKTTAMSIKAVEMCVHQFKKGDAVLIASLTEKQGYLMLAKSLAYAQEKYPGLIKLGKDKPTMHRITFTNGAVILCYASGETGEGLRGFTIKKLMIDEGSRMGEEFFIAVLPMLSVTKGSMDIASTPFGKKHKDGSEKFFYKCSKDDHYKKFIVEVEECPRINKDFLERMRTTMSKFHFAQEYGNQFTDELLRLFDEDMIKTICCLKRMKDTTNFYRSRLYLGVDVAGAGKDECTFEIIEKMKDGTIEQRENIINKLENKKTTETSKRIIQLNRISKFKKIGVDDGGVGYGVYSELMDEETTKRKTFALNNASRPIDKDGEKSKKLLKEEMYFNLLALMENKKIKLLDDDEVKASLSSIQYEDEEIFGSYSHVTEGIIRAVWLCTQDKDLNIWAHTF